MQIRPLKRCSDAGKHVPIPREFLTLSDGEQIKKKGTEKKMQAHEVLKP
jgi:hypothetical protein